jgi:hypothetical protein
MRQLVLSRTGAIQWVLEARNVRFAHIDSYTPKTTRHAALLLQQHRRAAHK